MSTSEIILIATLAIVGGLAQYLWVLNAQLAKAVLDAYRWIDEVIDALEDESEETGDQKIAGLVDLRKGE